MNQSRSKFVPERPTPDDEYSLAKGWAFAMAFSLGGYAALAGFAALAVAVISG